MKNLFIASMKNLLIASIVILSIYSLSLAFTSGKPPKPEMTQQEMKEVEDALVLAIAKSHLNQCNDIKQSSFCPSNTQSAK